MATLAAFLRRTDGTKSAQASKAGRRGLESCSARAARDAFQLRPLPLEDVFLYSKKIDNSRLVREADPQAGGRCWSAIGVASLAMLLTAGVAAPNMANILAGYRLENLEAQQAQLAEQRRALELKEAELLNPQKLDQLARERNLVVPSPGQVVHLEPKGEGAVAMVKR